MVKRTGAGLAVVVLMVALLTMGALAQDGSQHTLAIFSTTDLHQYIMPYNYIDDQPNENIGLTKVYTLLEEAREEYPNSLLFSAGDDIQGSLVGDMEAEVDPLTGHEFQSIIQAMNVMGYDAAAVGNHEVTDYGLEFFERARDNSVFPWLSANIMLADDPDEFYVEPYTILRRQVDGIPIDVGVIGFVPPQITDWGRRHLEGEVITRDIVEQARALIPELREKADIVVVVGHTGIDAGPIDSYDARENAGYWLAREVEGIDALILGHQHNYFPGDYPDIEGVDNEKGLIHGVPAAMAGSWGSALGVIELDLYYQDGQWEVVDGQSHLRETTEEVASHPRLEELVAEKHEATVEYVRTPIGETEIEIASYFSRIKDTAVTQLVNDAQLWYAEREFAGTEYEDLPILSAAAPFIAGREGPHYFTHVHEDVNIGDVTDIYLYPNTVYVVKLDGLQIVDWLERSAENFNQIDPEKEDPQHLVDYGFPGFNYDVLEGIEYTIDVTRPAGERIVEATYEGEPLCADMEFLVITNNYRASGGGDFPHMVDENVILASTDVNREQIIRFIEQKGVINPEPSRNWEIKPVETRGPVLYRSHPDAHEYLERMNIPGIIYQETDEDGWGIYEIKFMEMPGRMGKVETDEALERLVFLHTNDEHGVIKNYGRIAWKAAQLEEEYDHVFLVSGGDIFSGNPVVDEYVIDGENLRGKPMIDLMNMAGYDVLVIGNHEFDYGQEVLQDRIDDAEFPLILANIDAREGYLEDPEPYVILETELGTRVSFLGLVQITPAQIPSTHPGNLGGLEFFDPVEVALEYEYLREESEIFVGLTHLGYSWDQELAQAMGSLDLIIGGHSHSVIETPGLHNDVLIAQAGADTNYLGKIVVEYCPTEGQVVSREGRLLDVEDIDETKPEVEDRISYFEDQMEEIFARRINYMPETLSGNMELGSMMTDAMVENLMVDFAFQNNGGIRVSQMSGLITVGCVFEIEPFGNDIVIYDMLPDDIRSLLRYSYERRNSIDLQTAGMHYEVVINQLGDVVDINLYDLEGEPLDEDTVYEVALNSYVASAYEFEARDEGYNTYRRHNDLIVEYMEAITPEQLAAYRGVDRINIKTLPEGEGTEVGQTEVGLSTVDRREGAVTAGNLMADAVAHITGADIGTYPTSELNPGVELTAGPVYEESLSRVLYGSFGFDNNVTVATVTGRDVEQMIHGQNLWFGGPSTQVSRNVSYELILEDDEIVETLVYIDGERIDPEAEYTIGINSYQYQFYSDGIDVISSFTTDATEKGILLEYLQEVGVLDETIKEDRITIKSR